MRLWIHTMPAKLSAARGPRGRVMAAACTTMLLLGVGLACPPVQAQSDVAQRAPWQAPSDCQSEFSPTCQPARSCGRCGPSARVCDDEGGCEECGGGGGGRCAGNPDCDFSNPCLCGLGSLFGNDRFWLSAEYLLWWEKSANLPPLATTSPQGTAYNQAGVLDQPGTTVLFGGSVDPAPARVPGSRSAIGFPTATTWAWRPLICSSATRRRSSARRAMAIRFSPDRFTTCRPRRKTPPSSPTASNLTRPACRRARWTSATPPSSDSVEVLFRQVLLRRCGGQLDFLLGYRYGRFSDNLSVRLVDDLR